MQERDVRPGLRSLLEHFGDFKDDQSRLRRGHGAHNMALLGHFAINLVRLGRGKRSIKTMRKLAGWRPTELAYLLIPTPC